MPHKVFQPHPDSPRFSLEDLREDWDYEKQLRQVQKSFDECTLWYLRKKEREYEEKQKNAS